MDLDTRWFMARYEYGRAGGVKIGRGDGNTRTLSHVLKKHDKLQSRCQCTWTARLLDSKAMLNSLENERKLVGGEAESSDQGKPVDARELDLPRAYKARYVASDVGYDVVVDVILLEDVNQGTMCANEPVPFAVTDDCERRGD